MGTKHLGMITWVVTVQSLPTRSGHWSRLSGEDEEKSRLPGKKTLSPVLGGNP